MPDPAHEIERIKRVYTDVYRTEVQDIGYTWHPRNPVSIVYRQAQERAIIALWNQFNLPLENAKILDVGCGTGNFIRLLLSLGAQPQSLHGVDLMEQRISQAIKVVPGPVDLQVGNAAELPYPDAAFDLVNQFTMFSAVEDQGLRHAIASEIDRVLKPGGYLLWYDMKKGDGRTTWGVGLSEILALFPGLQCLSVQNLHAVWLSRLARRSWIAATLWDSLPWLAQARRLIKGWRPDVLHAHQVTSAGWLGAFSGFHPLVITPWGSDLYEQPRVSRLARWLARYVLRRADWVTADSEDLRQLAIQFGASTGRSSLNQWGVDLEVFHPAEDDCPGCQRLKVALGLREQLVVLSPRGMQPIYNLDRIIATIPTVLQNHPNTVYILRDYIATPGYRPQLEEQVDRLGVSRAIRWVGVIEPWEELVHIYHLADVAVSIPGSDATPVSLLEAMACGVPVIASDIRSLREWITSGENGVLVDPGDIDGLARSILSILDNPGVRDKFYTPNLKLLKEKAYHQEEMKKMEALYRQLISSSRQARADR